MRVLSPITRIPSREGRLLITAERVSFSGISSWDSPRAAISGVSVRAGLVSADLLVITTSGQQYAVPGVLFRDVLVAIELLGYLPHPSTPSAPKPLPFLSVPTNYTPGRLVVTEQLIRLEGRTTWEVARASVRGVSIEPGALTARLFVHTCDGRILSADHLPFNGALRAIETLGYVSHEHDSASHPPVPDLNFPPLPPLSPRPVSPRPSISTQPLPPLPPLDIVPPDAVPLDAAPRPARRAAPRTIPLGLPRESGQLPAIHPSTPALTAQPAPAPQPAPASQLPRRPTSPPALAAHPVSDAQRWVIARIHATSGSLARVFSSLHPLALLAPALILLHLLAHAQRWFMTRLRALPGRIGASLHTISRWVVGGKQRLSALLARVPALVLLLLSAVVRSPRRLLTRTGKPDAASPRTRRAVRPHRSASRGRNRRQGEVIRQARHVQGNRRSVGASGGRPPHAGLRPLATARRSLRPELHTHIATATAAASTSIRRVVAHPSLLAWPQRAGKRLTRAPLALARDSRRMVSATCVLFLAVLLSVGVITDHQVPTPAHGVLARHAAKPTAIAHPASPTAAIPPATATPVASPVAPPVLTVFAGSHDGSLYALRASDGTLLWRYNTGSQIESAPALAGGIVYAGSDNHTIYALRSQDDTIVWRYRTGDKVVGSPTVANGVVYIGSNDGYLYALRASDGTLLWRYRTGGWVVGQPAVVNGVIYFGSYDDYLYALRASDGALLWRFQTHGAVASSPAVVAGVVYAGSADHTLYALRASNGALLWWRKTDGSLLSSPTVSDGVIYIGSSDGALYAVRASDDTLLWRYTTGGQVLSSPVISGGTAYIGSNDGYLYALRASDGTLLWRYKTGGAVDTSPQIADGLVFAGSADHDVYALRADSGALVWSYKTGDAVSPRLAVGS